MFDFHRVFPSGVTASLDSGWPRPRGSGLHRGADLFTPVGTPVLAVAAGKVVHLQRSVNPTAGIWLVLQHEHGVVTRYLHLSRIAADLKVGSPVRRGQMIAWTGDTSTGTTGAHLHFDIKGPAQVLPMVARAIGEPRGGWGPEQPPWGYSIPVEPWLPVDRYPKRTIDDAAAYGIRLYKGPGVAAKFIIAGLVAYGVYRMLG